MQHNEILISEKPGFNYTSVLEEGDYIPYFVHKSNGSKISIQNSAGQPNIFVVMDKCDKVDFKKCNHFSIPTHIICKETNYVNSHVINNEHIHKIFPNNKVILTTPNLKINKIYNNISEISEGDIENIPILNPPIIVVPNVISESLRNELIHYHDESNRKNIENKGSKNRTHVFANPELTKKLDDKLCKSLFPELKKVFNIDVTYRENYKICSYNSEDRGKFHAHRDSVYPYGHRRFAMSLILNDDYEGGGIIFPEYNRVAYKPEPCSAVIFPTPLYHQVLEVTGGTRYVIISFLLGDESAEYKRRFNKDQGKSDNISNYKMNMVRDQRDFFVDDICPQT